MKKSKYKFTFSEDPNKNTLKVENFGGQTEEITVDNLKKESKLIHYITDFESKLPLIVDICNNITEYYLEFQIKKSNGKKRLIEAPFDELKNLQNDLLHNFFYKFRAHESAKGFVKNVGIKDSAEFHLDSNIILNTDIRNFFPSIKYRHVIKLISRLDYQLGLMGHEKLHGVDYKIMAILCTYNGATPQGAPTSPAIANLYCKKLDNKLYTLAEKFNLKYTRYADDMTFSHPDKNYDIGKIVPIIDVYVNGYGFKMNPDKTRIMKPHQRMMVTGVVVNEKLSVPRYKWRNFRAKLHNLLKNGTKISPEEYKKLRGYIEWIKQLHPKRGKRMLKKLGTIPLDQP